MIFFDSRLTTMALRGLSHFRPLNKYTENATFKRVPARSAQDIGILYWVDLKLVEQLHISPEENNKPLKAECKQICEQTGALLHPVDDIATYVEAAWLNPDLVDTRTWQCAVRVFDSNRSRNL